MKIDYSVNQAISTEQFINLLQDSSLGERRPVEDIDCIKGMVENSNLMITAWHKDKLVGVSRCLTDFYYACYLSDLAVSKDYQHLGIGKKLQVVTKNQLGPRCKLVLLAAPTANEYYPHIGYENNPRCWVLNPD